MNFLALHDDVKFIISAHLASDFKNKSNVIKNMLVVEAYGYKQHFGEDIFVFCKEWGRTTYIKGLDTQIIGDGTFARVAFALLCHSSKPKNNPRVS